jgi:hypothetical protein
MSYNTYEVGREKQVFIDWDLIEPGYGVGWGKQGPKSWEMPYGVRIAVHRPRIDEQPLVWPDRPWESSINVYSTLFEDEGRYRLYYECLYRRERERQGGLQAMMAYSESTDGVNWEKPTVGTVAFKGSTENNLVYGLDASLGRGVSGGTVFKDLSAPADERYKLVHMGYEEGVPCVFGAVSPDGLRWKALEKPLIRGYLSDTQTVVTFDREKERYVGYFRGWKGMEYGKWHNRRTIAYAETDRFESWPMPQTIAAPDVNDDPDVDLYTNAYVRWPGTTDAHLMFPALYRRAPDVLEMHLMTSRDGLGWQRPSREPLIPSGEPGSGWDGGVYAGRGLASFDPGEWTLPIGPRWHTHNQARFETKGSVEPPNRGYLCRAKWREDGFTSIQAETEGRCTTVPITFDGGELKVNVWTRFGGEVRVELANALGEEMERAEAVEGHTLEECDPISGDVLGHTVTWSGKSDLRTWAGKPARLRFLLRRARLHAIQFV